MTNPQEQAEALVAKVTGDIRKARADLATEMTKDGKQPPEWAIGDNMEEFIDHPELGYKCWAYLTETKPRFTRATNTTK